MTDELQGPRNSAPHNGTAKRILWWLLGIASAAFFGTAGFWAKGVSENLAAAERDRSVVTERVVRVEAEISHIKEGLDELKREAVANREVLVQIRTLLARQQSP